jgi:hypothetical protein
MAILRPYLYALQQILPCASPHDCTSWDRVHRHTDGMGAVQMLEAFDNSDSKVEAAVRAFSRVMNPEDWHAVHSLFSSRQQDSIAEQLGMLSVLCCREMMETLCWSANQCGQCGNTDAYSSCIKLCRNGVFLQSQESYGSLPLAAQ